MNQKQLAIKKNQTAKLFQHTTRIHRNCIRINIGNTLEHELKKFRMCYALKKGGEEFLTEAVFHNGKRADIVSLDREIAFEIIASEKEDSLLKKESLYPIPIRKIYLNGGFE